MYRVWYSTESFADFIIDNTQLRSEVVCKSKMYESDANNPNNFHAIPDHIKKILYLDAPDLIVEIENEPIFTIEVSTEAGTGHNSFQRFSRIAASVENQVPAFYIYPEGAIITRKNSPPTWDKINPIIFQALESVMSIYDIPALLYYFPTDINNYPNASTSPNIRNKGKIYDSNFTDYPGCPNSSDSEMQHLFEGIDRVLESTKVRGTINGRMHLLRDLIIRNRRNFMQSEYHAKSQGKNKNGMSPLSATIKVPTNYLINYLSQYETTNYSIGELLHSRESTIIYQVDAIFRGDPYPGSLAGIDYLLCREGKTFEDRKHNLVLAFGKVEVDDINHTIKIVCSKSTSVNDFFAAVQMGERKNLLNKNYAELDSKSIPRYYMQVRYGSSYSKVKHIRVYSYFADSILFQDGSLWRDA